MKNIDSNQIKSSLNWGNDKSAWFLYSAILERSQSSYLFVFFLFLKKDMYSMKKKEKTGATNRLHRSTWPHRHHSFFTPFSLHCVYICAGTRALCSFDLTSWNMSYRLSTRDVKKKKKKNYAARSWGVSNVASAVFLYDTLHRIKHFVPVAPIILSDLSMRQVVVTYDRMICRMNRVTSKWFVHLSVTTLCYIMYVYWLFVRFYITCMKQLPPL